MDPKIYDTVIFDIGDVLFDWDSSAITALPRNMIHQMMHTETWYGLEKNAMSTGEAYTKLGKDFDVDPSLVRLAFDQAQSTLRVNEEASALIQELAAAKARHAGRIKVYAMSNIAEEHMAIVQTVASFPWSVFDRVFTSFKAGMRKPDVSFYRHVIQETGCNPSSTLYLDDKAENICAGRMLGLRGEIVHPDHRTGAFNIVKNLLLEGASQRAERFLSIHAGKLDSVISVPGKEDRVLKDNFAQLMIWAVTGMEDIVYLVWPDGTVTGRHQRPDVALPAGPVSISDASSPCSSSSSNHSSPSASPQTSTPSSPSSEHQPAIQHGLWNYFAQQPILTTTTFPPDIETTSIAYLTIPPSHPHYHRLASPSTIAETMLANRDKEGHFETYFTPARHGRVNPEVCVSVLRLLNKFASAGQIPGIPHLDVDDERIEKSKKLVMDCLRHRANLYGNRFYPFPEPFLYWVSMLCSECKDSSPQLYAELAGELEQVLMERLNVPLNALALAMRVRACQLAGLGRELVQRDLDTLLGMQEGDGGWPAGEFCSYGRVQSRRIGSRGWTTALAWRILKEYGM
ncbi:Haloacid dehalogenase-like hydrolase-domain-containing protein [Cercophora samala]|uniref:Haloacid dehalogenase-like hydrolase-domain-containing protein n=1 Tax=Cercophora samala TaxID=330535 RepID=A0AA39YXN2_9PEZI|nr:Haloacid dehalogenase-like hydrolase-domain-containing protein [Cercophora samala]